MPKAQAPLSPTFSDDKKDDDDDDEEEEPVFFHLAKWDMVAEFSLLYEIELTPGRVKPFNLSYKHDTYGRTCLIWSARNGNVAMTQYLLSQKAEMEARDSDNATPLMHACHGSECYVNQKHINRNQHCYRHIHHNIFIVASQITKRWPECSSRPVRR